jgi:biopolymer transport protein ExbD
MSIRSPGKRARIPVRSSVTRAVARALPSRLCDAAPARRGSPALSMTSMIDVMVVLVVFLLLSFNSDVCTCITRHFDLPSAFQTTDLVDGPTVEVASNGLIFVDGQPARDETTDPRRVHRIDEVFNDLKGKHETAKILRPDRPPPQHVILAIDSDVPAALVKSVVQTAALAGYPQVDFKVEQRRRP